MATIETPILIVGAGPVGLALAADLGGRGVPCLVVEQGDGVPEHPRASAINARSMEFMRRWGVADKMREVGTPTDFPHTALYCTTLRASRSRASSGRTTAAAARRPASPERPQRCNQLWLDPVLRELAQATTASTSAHRHRFESLREEGDHVVATVHDLASDQRIEIAAPYVIDCSGGHSPIRRAARHRHERLVLSRLFHLASSCARRNCGPTTRWARRRCAGSSTPKGLWRNYVNLDGRELYRFGISGKAFYDAPEKVDAERTFREVVGKDVPHEILSVVRWIARNVVADRYRVGRIFLAGDAAHLNHPSAGLGLNTGLGDAVDLGWKLAAVHHGWARSALLDSYETERRPVGIRNVGHADESHAGDRERTPGPAIADDTPEGARVRQAAGRRHRAEPDQEGDHRRARARLPLRSLADRLGRRHAGAASTPSPTITRPRGPAAARRMPGIAHGRSTIDLFGKGFVLMRLGAERRTCRRSSARSRSAACRCSVETIDNPDDRRALRTRSSCWCVPTATSPGAPTRRRPIRWRSPTVCAAVSDPPPRRSACRRDRRGGSCRAGTSPAASAARRLRNRNRSASDEAADSASRPRRGSS